MSAFARSRLLMLAFFGGALIAVATACAVRSAAAQSLAEYITALCSEAFRSTSPEEAPFLAENVGAMTRMMVGMEVQPSGDVDRDFVEMMVPHHQGAIDMAMAVLRHGQNEQLGAWRRRSLLPSSRRSRPCASRSAIPCRLQRPPPTQPMRPYTAAMKEADDEIQLPARRHCLAAVLAAPSALPARHPARLPTPDIPISHRDRVYAAEQFSNTVSVTDPADNRLLGVIQLGRAAAGELQPALSGPGAGARHGLLARPPDAGRGLDRLNSVTFIDTATNAVKHIDLCRPLAARGVLLAGRQGGLGHRSRRRLCRRCWTADVRGEGADHHAQRPGHDRSSRRTAGTATSARRSLPRPS